MCAIRIGTLAEITKGESIKVVLGSLTTALHPGTKVAIVAQHQNNVDYEDENDGNKLYMVHWDVLGLCMGDDEKSVTVPFYAFVRGNRLDTEY